MRSSSLVLVVLALCVSSEAAAQYSKDNSSPPIDVPTAPVPQGPTPPPPPPPAKPAAPKPAPAPAPAPVAPAAPAPAPAPPAGTEKKDEQPKSEPKYNNEGVFKISGSKGPGVVVGGKPTAKGKVAAKSDKGAVAVKKSSAIIAQWPGFRLTEDGGSEVMVEFSQNPAAPTEHKAAGSLTYVFKGQHAIKSNNKNPLITVHFNTPIASARLVPKAGELHLVIDYRAGVTATALSGVRASSDGDGQQFFVKLPAGAWLPPGADDEPMPPPPTQKLKNKAKDDKPAAGSAPPKSDAGGAKTGPNP